MQTPFTFLEKILCGIVAIVVIVFCFRECSHQSEKNDLVNNIANYKDSAKTYKIKVDGMAVDVAYNKSLNLENKDQIASILKKNDTLFKMIKNFKSVGSVTNVTNNTTIIGDTMKFKKKDSIPCDFKPFSVTKEDKNFHFVGTIAQKYFTIDTLSIPNKMSVVTGRKNIGFLKWEDRAEITNSNPLVKITNIGSYVVIPNKKRLGVGASAGYGFSLSNNQVRISPFIGLSFNYNLFQF